MASNGTGHAKICKAVFRYATTICAWNGQKVLRNSDHPAQFETAAGEEFHHQAASGAMAVGATAGRPPE